MTEAIGKSAATPVIEGRGPESAQGEPGSHYARWFAVRTLAHREFAAATQLVAQNFESFLPTHLKTVRHARRFRTARAPFFPGYLFVRLDLQRDRWRSVNGTFGVACLVMAGDRPAAVPRGVVEALRAWSDAAGFISSARDFSPGQKVRVHAGPFAEKVGTLHRLDGHGRVQVLLELMGAQVPVDIAECALSAA